MSDILTIIVPVIGLFGLGLLLRFTNILKQQDADVLLKIAFYVALPALILKTIPSIELDPQFLYLPLISTFLIISSSAIATVITKKILVDYGRKTKGVFIVGSMIMNLGFNIPFVLIAYGNEGFARASFIDIGNIFLTLSLTYYIAQKYGKSAEEKENLSFINKKLVFSPPLLALIISIIINLSSFTIPLLIEDFIELLAAMITPLLMLSIGIYFQPTMDKLRLACGVITIRMGFGLIIGSLFALLFPFDDLTKKIIIISSAAPVGFNTLTYASLEDLDRPFAANIVSLSIPLGIVVISLLVMIL